LVAVGVLAVRGLRRPNRVASAAKWRPPAELTIAATGLVVGYAASTLTGPSHLRYGFARDFILPALLVAIVAVVLGSRALWVLLERRRGTRVSPEILYVAAAVLVAGVVVSVPTVTRTSGLPRIESRHVGAVTYTARCVGQECRVGVEATTRGGRSIALPQPATLTFGCGSDRPRYTVYVTGLDRSVQVAAACSDPRLVAAWPTVMGLPPGAFELAAIGVRNV
jgi:hypothetical protein